MALMVAVAALFQQACSDHPTPLTPTPLTPTPPDTSHAAAGNAVRVCAGGVNPVKNHIPKTSPGLTLTPDSGTVTLGAGLRTRVTDNDFFTPPNHSSLVAVLPAMYGRDLLATNDGTQTGIASADYIAPINCTGVDSVWYVVESSPGVRDTGLLVVHITHPVIAKQDSVDVITEQTTKRKLLPTFYDALAAWPNSRVVGFVGSSHGTAAIASDSEFAYTAPATFTGVDSVRVIFEATIQKVAFRDTTLARFNVLRRAAPPGPYDVVPITGPGATLAASSLSTDGKIAGTATLANGETHAFKWVAGVYTDLGAYDGARTVGVGINASGDVAGYAKKSDSSTVTLVWKANGVVLELGPGQPQSVGITDGGAVVTPKTYFVDGRAVRQIFGAQAINNVGVVLQYFPDELYGECELMYPDGRTRLLGYGHGCKPVLMNDSADVWMNTSSGAPSVDVLALGAAEGRSLNQVPVANVFPEFAPPGSNFAAQRPLKLDNQRNLLENNLLVTERGAFAIDDYIADHTWHLVLAITMNDRGQILGVGRNDGTGVTAPILLTPLTRRAASFHQSPGEAAGAVPRSAVNAERAIPRRPEAER